MQLTELRLQQFRNLLRLDFQPQPGLNILGGANAQGKTNILEAVYVTGTTTSFRSGKETNLINHQASCCIINACHQKEDRAVQSRLCFDREQGKVFQINGKKAYRNHADRLRVVLFTPDDLYLIKGSPAKRREFLDFTLRQISRPYAYEFNNYLGLLKRRNDMLRKEQGHHKTYAIINDLFIKSAAEVTIARIRFIHHLQEKAGMIHQRLAGTGHELKLRYALSFPVDSDTINLDILREHLLHAGYNKREQERIRRISLIGPHLDDLNIYIDNKLARWFASQGQQRHLVVVLKLAEIYSFAAITGYYPIFLLDEVLAEFDQQHKALLLEELAQAKYQAFLTSVEAISTVPPQAALYQVHNGTITRKE
ncbi:MAG: DNA replication/repair protein RecF [Syntrophomonadaceae bacterium]